jgi:hypothetical protein
VCLFDSGCSVEAVLLPIGDRSYLASNAFQNAPGKRSNFIKFTRQSSGKLLITRLYERCEPYRP